MLAQFVLIVFALFAVLSLVVDVGFARITQAQMQNAADVAALEGLRQRDVLASTPGQNNAFANDCLRRSSAHRLVRWVFDDDFNVAAGDDYQFGAGPVIDLTDGVGSLHALETLSVSDVPVYKPDLQVNQQNQVHGDMVSGRFLYSDDPAPSEGFVYSDPDLIVATEQQHASGVYARNDFNPNPAAPQAPPVLGACPPPDDAPPDAWPAGGSGSLDTVDDSAFLVRLRRSNEFPDADPDVASSGPSLPLVFARGTTIFGDDPAGGYSVRRDGLTVRATAISEIRPAMHVGLPQTTPSLPGVTPFTLRDTFAATLNAAGSQVTVNPANGVICSGVIPPAAIATCTATSATAIARFIGNANRIAVSTVGQAIPAPVPTACAAAASLTLSGYGPVYSLMTSGVNRIVGFTRIGVAADPARPFNAAACPAVVFRGVSLVAASNATAIVPTGLPLPTTASAADVRELLSRNCPPALLPSCPAALPGITAVNYAPVLVPVLAR